MVFGEDGEVGAGCRGRAEIGFCAGKIGFYREGLGGLSRVYEFGERVSDLGL